MGSSYLGVDVFGSGAHRFVAGRQGRRPTPPVHPMEWAAGYRAGHSAAVR